MCVETCVKISDKSDKKWRNHQNLEFSSYFNLTQVFYNTKSKLKKRTMLRGKATLVLWFEPAHDYVGPAVTEIIYGRVGLIRAGFSAVGLFVDRKSKISHETKC